MKNLFKKKKSDNKLAPQPIQYDTTPKKPIVLGDTPLQAPPLMMPKPKRALTPTRAILGRFDNDKTEVEESPLQDISPILLPTAHHDSNPPPPSKSLHQHLSTLSVTGSDDSSRVYESAVESPSTSSASREEVMDLPEFPPEAVLVQKELEMQQKLKEEQQRKLEQQKMEQQKLEQQKELERQELIKQREFKQQQELARKQELERQQELQKQQEIEKQQELARQQELEQQKEIERQNELEKQNYIKRQKQLELEHIKAQFQFQEHQYHEQQFEQQKQQFLQQHAQSGISDASSRTVSPGQRHLQMSSASSATATPMIKVVTPIEEKEILRELKRQLDQMERQRAKDREEWRRKEEELMNQSNQMMEKLKETEGQLSMALQQEEEIRRVPYRSRSEEHLKRRSASRSSYHPQEYPQEECYPEYPKESLSRRSSNGSHRSRRSRSKSIESRRMEPEEVRPPHPQRSRSAGRPSAKSPAMPMYYDEYEDPRYYQDYYRYYRRYGYPADYYNQQYMRPAPSRSTQSRGYPGYYYR